MIPVFRFTIRDVLWLTVVVAVTFGLGLGWWIDHQQMSEMCEAWKNFALHGQPWPPD